MPPRLSNLLIICRTSRKHFCFKILRSVMPEYWAGVARVRCLFKGRRTVGTNGELGVAEAMQFHRFGAGLTQVLHRVSTELLGWQQIVAVEEWNRIRGGLAKDWLWVDVRFTRLCSKGRFWGGLSQIRVALVGKCRCRPDSSGIEKAPVQGWSWCSI